MDNLRLYDMKRLPLSQRLSNFKSVIFADRIYIVDDGDVFYIDDDENSVQISQQYKCITDITHHTSMQCVCFGTGREFVFIDQYTFELTTALSELPYYTACWSPNQDLLAVCELSAKIKLYRVNFENMTIVPEINFNNEHDTPLTKDPNMSHLQPAIAWKPNSKMFGVGHYAERYKIRIYSLNDGEHEVEVDVPNLLSLFTWRGNKIIAMEEYEPQKFAFCMYEKNSLFHSRYLLDSKVESVSQIAWNEVGDVLAVHIKNKNGSFLNLYTFKNYKHQLKQQLVFTMENPLLAFQFIDSSRYTVHLMAVNPQEIIFHKFLPYVQFEVHPTDSSFYAEIDNNVLKVQRVVGDYLSGTHEPIAIVSTENPINAVAFHKECKKFVIIDSHSRIFGYTFIENRVSKIFERIPDTGRNNRFLPIRVYNPCFTTENVVAFSFLNNVGSRDLYALNFFANSLSPLRLAENIIHMKFIPEINKLLKINSTFNIYLDTTFHGSWLIFEPRMCNYFIIDEELYIVILDTFDQLWVNEHQVCKGATSFLIHKGYLYVTTSTDKLFCIHLASEEVAKLCELYSITKFYSRPCEDNNLTLLFGVTNTHEVVLRHPRGNTETVLCRNIAIVELEKLIRLRTWKDAFHYVRLQRLNPNLLIDIDPDLFLEDLESFIAEIDPNWVQSLLLLLSDANVLTTIYKNVNYPNIKILDNKKKTINAAILDILVRDLKTHIKSVMMAIFTVKDASAAVQFLYDFYQENGNSDNIVKDGLDCLQLYVVDQEICKMAFSKVDLNFTRCVFDHFRVDPKSYERLFELIESHSNNRYRQCYIAHKYMENYSIALEYLVASCMFLKATQDNYDDEQDVLEIIEHAVYNRLLPDLYKYCLKHDFVNHEIIRIYVRKLKGESRYEEGALIFSKHEMWEDAFECYTQCRMWKESLHTLDRMQLTDVEKAQHILKLTSPLEKHGEYSSAAHLYEEYLSLPELAVDCFLRGKLFEEAIRCCHRCNRQGLIEAKIKASFEEYYEDILARIKKITVLFEKRTARLAVVRAANIKKAEDIVTGNEGYAESIAGSLHSESTRSRSSTNSSRSKKEERKKQDLREGGPYENIALLREIHNLVREAYELCPDVKKLCSLIITFEFNMDKATHVQCSLSELLDTIDGQISVIWPIHLNNFNVITPDMVALRENISEIDMVYRFPPDPPKTKWKIKLLDEVVD